MVYFVLMNEEELRQWVEANPGRVNDRDKDGFTPLHVAARPTGNLPLVLWLLDEKGADVNATTSKGWTALHDAASLGILKALLSRGADPTVHDQNGISPLMQHACHGNIDLVARLLQDPRVRATINVQTTDGGSTALHHACNFQWRKASAESIPYLLLEAGADPYIPNKEGLIPVAYLLEHSPGDDHIIALHRRVLAHIVKTWIIVKARRFVVAASNAIAPSYLQQRVVRGQPLPRVAMAPVTGGQNHEHEEKHRKLLTLLAFIFGMGGGPEGGGMPRDVFRLVMDLLMPSWDPLHGGVAGAWVLGQGAWKEEKEEEEEWGEEEEEEWEEEEWEEEEDDVEGMIWGLPRVRKER